MISLKDLESKLIPKQGHNISKSCWVSVIGLHKHEKGRVIRTRVNIGKFTVKGIKFVDKPAQNLENRKETKITL